MKIILGSQSQSRHDILKSMGYAFEVMTADINEKAIKGSNPKELVLAIARAKADALIPRIHEPAVLITADHIVMHNGKMRGKPKDKHEARAFLLDHMFSPIETITAIVGVNTATKLWSEGVHIARVWFNLIPEEIIDRLISEGDVYNRSGGFSVEHPLLKKYVKNIEGGIDSIMGLPKVLTKKVINEAMNGKS